MMLTGRSAIVFGGGSGLGEATARRLREEGAEVVVADRAADRARSIADEIGGRAAAADVTDETSVAAALALAAESGDGLRVCVNCAGVATPKKLVGRDGPAPLSHFAEVVGINLIGSLNVLRLAAAAMGENEPDDGGERGVCVQTASIAAYDGQAGQTAYAASKGGVASLTLPAARELAPLGIRVLAVAPGIFQTPLLAGLPEAALQTLGESVPFPPRLGRPPEFADLVAHLIGNQLMNGEVVRLDGALRMPAR